MSTADPAGGAPSGRRRAVGWCRVPLRAPRQLGVEIADHLPQARRPAWSARRAALAVLLRAHRSLAGQSPPRCGRSRPPCSNTQAKDSRPCAGTGCSSRLRPACALPPDRFRVPVESRHGPVRKLGKDPGQPAMPHRFSTGKPMRPVDFSVENSRPKCDRLFLLHSLWIASVAGQGRCRTGLETALVHKPSTGCAQACHRFSTALSTDSCWPPRSRRRAARMSEPSMSDPFGRTVSTTGTGL